MRFTYDVNQRTATVLGRPIKLNGKENTILVRDVKIASGPAIAAVTTLDLSVGDVPQTFADLFRRSPTVVAFLRCDAGTPNELVNAVARRFVCDLL